MHQGNSRSPGAFEGCSCDVPRRDDRLRSARNRIAGKTNRQQKTRLAAIAAIVAIATHAQYSSTVQGDAKFKDRTTASPCKAQRKSRRNMRTHGSAQSKERIPLTQKRPRARGVSRGAHATKLLASVSLTVLLSHQSPRKETYK